MRLLLLLPLAVLAGEASPTRVVLSGAVDGASGEHPVHVALWDQAGFLEHPVREIRLEPGAELSFRFDVPAGQWALSAFEDRNENGKLDMGLFGPKEPTGFWRPFHGWRKPRFDEVAEAVDRDRDDVVIHLK